MSNSKCTVNETKKTIKRPAVPGTKPSLQNAQLLISTGIPSLDNVIGGGLPIGSIMLFEEDKYGFYAKTILKYFMAEGCVTSHELFVASQDTSTEQLIVELPGHVIHPNDLTYSPLNLSCNTDSNKMQIAWRYQNMKIADSLSSGRNDCFDHYYDLTKSMDRATIDRTNITYWNGDGRYSWQSSGFNNIAYVDLLKNIQKTLRDRQFYVTSKPDKRNIMRIGILSLGSRLWINDNDDANRSDLIKFLYCFRSILRNCYAVAVITVPSGNFDNYDTAERLEHLADTVIGLESFAGSSKETNPIYKDYHGLLHIKKLSAINSLEPHCPQSLDLAFKLRRKKFVIEILHLPPDFNELEHNSDKQSPALSGCGTVQKILDF